MPNGSTFCIINHPAAPSRRAMFNGMCLNGQKIAYRGKRWTCRAGMNGACFPRTPKNTRVSIPVDRRSCREDFEMCVLPNKQDYQRSFTVDITRFAHFCSRRLTSCSQKRITSHPVRRSSRVTTLSRATFAEILRRQKLALFLGQTRCLEHACQKQPSTNTTIFAFLKVRSGRPGSLTESL